MTEAEKHLVETKKYGTHIIDLRHHEITADGLLDGKPWPLRVNELAQRITRRRARQCK